MNTAVGNFGIENRKLGMLLFLASEAMFFTGLIGAYIVLRRSAADWPEASGFLNISLGFVSTAVLLASSLTFAISRGKSLWLWATGFLGILFLGIQGYEYHGLMTQKQLFPSTNLFGASFFTLTGFHGLHVLAGVWCLILLTALKKMKSLEVLSYYWHFVDGVWLVLFGLLYLN